MNRVTKKDEENPGNPCLPVGRLRILVQTIYKTPDKNHNSYRTLAPEKEFVYIMQRITPLMKKSYIFITAFLLIASCLLPTFSFAQYTSLYELSGAADGQYPTGDLFSDGNFLYGMSYHGGVNGQGSIFKVKLDGTGAAKLLDFDGASNGERPFGSLTSDGAFLYGMTSTGGINTMGVIFKIKPDGSGYSKLLDFSGSATGAFPEGSLIYDGSFLYGMTTGGGANGVGVIFKMKTDGSGFTKLLDFSNANGKWPYGSLNYDGVYLYGMTMKGGANNGGCIFKIKTDGTGYSKVYDFSTGAMGGGPNGSLILKDDFLYGMTASGGIYGWGNIFKIKTDGTGYANLFDFDDTNGGAPQGSLTYVCPFLYGMSMRGNSNYGVAFKIKTDGTEFTNLINFTKAGSEPYGSFISVGAALYGMTCYGGSFGDGTIFKYEVQPSNDVLCNPLPPSCENFFIPNLITPNGDGDNDRFEITGCNDQWKVEFYNSLGIKVFEKDTYKDEWDGSGEAEGVYYYNILDKDTNKSYKGWVHLVRS
jgi:gliding motility-associated-like protein